MELGVATAVRIEVRVVGRWNARALVERLAPWRSFLVQHGPERWILHAQAPGCHGESLEAAIAAIERCLDERGVRETSIRIDRTAPRIEIRCSGCGYGGVVAHIPDRCPMCGGTSWRRLSSRSGRLDRAAA